MSHRNDRDWEVIVIGGGVAGLTAGALLAYERAKVLVLERHTIAGGCASFFQTQGYRFDVGATVAGGFGPRGLHRKIFERLHIDVAAEQLEPAMIVHSDGKTITRWGDGRWQAERIQHFGPEAEPFWQLQEKIADRAWDLAADLPALPVDWRSALHTIRLLRPKDVALCQVIGRTVKNLMPNIPTLGSFVDAQLLITAQATSAKTDALYGLTALDLAREGVFHLPAGLSSIPLQLAKAVRKYGGQIRYATSVESITLNRQGHVDGVQLQGGEQLRSSKIISAIPIADTNRLLPEQYRISSGKQQVVQPEWGAFMAYVGLPPEVVPHNFPLHHQMICDSRIPLGEGNSLFFSFSAQGELQRSRSGGRAVTISTHTDIQRWQDAWQRGSYLEERNRLGKVLLAGLDRLIDGASSSAEYIGYATPHTFEKYTGRLRGAVGGRPQTPWHANILAPSHQSGIKGLLLCGDSVFPGQSTVSVSHSACIAVQQCKAFDW